MKYLLILLTSFTAVNHLLAGEIQQKITADFGNGGNAQYKACIRGYNARSPILQQNGLFVRPAIDTNMIEIIKEYYPKNSPKAPDASWSNKWRISNTMQDAALWGYFYAGCSDQNGGEGAHRSGANTGWFGEKGYGVLGQQQNGEYGWNHQPGCWPQATQGNGAVCGDKFANPA
jgi:hypothetical protein